MKCWCFFRGTQVFLAMEKPKIAWDGNKVVDGIKKARDTNLEKTRYEVLKRLPTKALIRLKSVCRAWNIKILNPQTNRSSSHNYSASSTSPKHPHQYLFCSPTHLTESRTLPSAFYWKVLSLRATQTMWYLMLPGSG